MDFKKVVAGAFYYINEYKRTLAKALFLPFLAIISIDVMTEMLEPNMAVYIVLGLVSVVVQTIFAITTHRVVLLGPSSISAWGITSWSKRESFFVLHIIGISIMGIPFALLGFIPIVGGITALILICWFAGRLCLVFPGIAVDKGVSFKLSWELTEHHQLLMFLVVILFPTLLAIPSVILVLLPHGYILSSIFSAFILVFQVAALSMAYLLITKDAYKK